MMQVSADIEGFLETNVISCLRRHQLVGQQGALDSCELTKHKQYQAKLTNNFREEGNYKFVAFLARKLASCLSMVSAYKRVLEFQLHANSAARRDGFYDALG
jgi:hypothetical protein